MAAHAGATSKGLPGLAQISRAPKTVWFRPFLLGLYGAFGVAIQMYACHRQRAGQWWGEDAAGILATGESLVIDEADPADLDTSLAVTV